MSRSAASLSLCLLVATFAYSAGCGSKVTGLFEDGGGGDGGASSGQTSGATVATGQATGPGQTGPGSTTQAQTGPGSTGAPGSTGPGQTGPGQTGPGPQTSVATGPQSCDQLFDCSACIDCSIQGNCADEYDACFADQDCVLYAECLEACQGTPDPEPCYQGCGMSYPGGAQLYQAAVVCVICDDCPMSCGGC